jgi:hypothetical protein
LGNRVRTIEPSSGELAVWVKLNYNLIVRLVGVRSPCGVFLFVVLEDAMLLSLLDVLSICLEGDVEQCVATKH